MRRCASLNLFPSRVGAVALKPWEVGDLRGSVVLNTTANALRSLLAGSPLRCASAVGDRAFGDGASHNISVNRTSTGGLCPRLAAGYL